MATRVLIAIGGLLLPLWAHGSTEVIAHVLEVGTYGNGNVFIRLDQSIPETNCPNPYIELPAAAPAARNAIATATMAVATGAAVKVVTDGCLNGVPSFSGARPAYITVLSP
jgi:hypothetical protein